MSAPTVTVVAEAPPGGSSSTKPGRVRVLRAPPLEPPFEDEVDPAWPPSPATTPLTQPGRGPRTQRPVTPRPLRGPAEAAAAAHPYGRPGPSPGMLAAQRFVSVCVEVLNGHRAASHLRAVTAPADFKPVTDQLISRTNRLYLGRPGPTVTRPQRVRLLGMRMCEPRDGVVEVAVVLGYGIQTWAMAVRMERPADTWLCKLVQVV
jgi:hypothetical protein